MKSIILFISILAITLLAPIKMMAQPDPCTDPTDPCPIDSNLVVLVIVAVSIAAKKVYFDKKKIANLT